MLSVAALGRDAAGLAIAPFSNTFPQVSAPGVAITSAALGGGLRVDERHEHGDARTSPASPRCGGSSRAPRPARARDSVHAKTLATARTEGFAPETDIADRGVGIVTAP